MNSNKINDLCSAKITNEALHNLLKKTTIWPLNNVESCFSHCGALIDKKENEIRYNQFGLQERKWLWKQLIYTI